MQIRNCFTLKWCLQFWCSRLADNSTAGGSKYVEWSCGPRWVRSYKRRNFILTNYSAVASTAVDHTESMRREASQHTTHHTHYTTLHINHAIMHSLNKTMWHILKVQHNLRLLVLDCAVSQFILGKGSRLSNWLLGLLVSHLPLRLLNQPGRVRQRQCTGGDPVHAD